ncbi:MAG TPA: LacI family DNA-binding transcriptional regulator [Burkholderiaceae bacterium]|nr:LacI family DNA-binding transcriptional regulator [Burkholderiaceae bacterium]
MNPALPKALTKASAIAKADAGKRGDRGLTVKDVARVAGVAVGTVSRVLNDNATVMPQVRERVLAAMRELNYEPNVLARSMRAGSTRAVGCIVSDVVQMTAAQMLNGAEEVLRDAGYAMYMASSHYDLEREKSIISSFRQRKIDGLILVISDDEDPGYLSFLQSLRVPIILWEREAGGLFSSALSDHHGGCLQAAAYLQGLGHERIALVAGREHTWVGREMVRGYEQAHRERGTVVAPSLISRTDRFDVAACTQLLTQANRPTAVIAPINDLALLMSVARTLGLQVPADISVISIGDSSLLGIFNPGITVVRHDPLEVGRTAARLLLAALEGEASAEQKVLFPAELVVRGSCARPILGK